MIKDILKDNVSFKQVKQMINVLKDILKDKLSFMIIQLMDSDVSGQCVPIGYTSRFNVIGHVIGQSVQYGIGAGNRDVATSGITTKQLLDKV